MNVTFHIYMHLQGIDAVITNLLTTSKQRTFYNIGEYIYFDLQVERLIRWDENIAYIKNVKSF
jgi:hypothetical protein